MSPQQQPQHEPTIPPSSPGLFAVGVSLSEPADDMPVSGVHDTAGLLHDEAFEVVESTTINVDDPDAEVVAGNGARRGLFGR
jgi:hypothetical protein